MTFEVMIGESFIYNPFPPTIQDAVMQNVRSILATRRGSSPLNRDFGIDYGLLDQPMNVAYGKLTSEIVRQVSLYEPRARVTRVIMGYSQQNPTRLQPTVQIEVNV